MASAILWSVMALSAVTNALPNLISASQVTDSLVVVTACTPFTNTFTLTAPSPTTVTNTACTCANGHIVGLNTFTTDGTTMSTCVENTGGPITTPPASPTGCGTVLSTVTLTSPSASTSTSTYCTCDDGGVRGDYREVPLLGYLDHMCSVTKTSSTYDILMSHEATPTATVAIMAVRNWKFGSANGAVWPRWAAIDSTKFDGDAISRKDPDKYQQYAWCNVGSNIPHPALYKVWKDDGPPKKPNDLLKAWYSHDRLKQDKMPLPGDGPREFDVTRNGSTLLCTYQPKGDGTIGDYGEISCAGQNSRANCDLDLTHVSEPGLGFDCTASG